jgi:hypothetical protein
MQQPTLYGIIVDEINNCFILLFQAVTITLDALHFTYKNLVHVYSIRPIFHIIVKFSNCMEIWYEVEARCHTRTCPPCRHLQIVLIYYLVGPNHILFAIFNKMRH